MKLLGFWREIDAEEGHLKRSFEVEDDDTRFLGDLYQELSERAKDKFALLQTPVFIEEFILERTLTPAIDEFGLETVRMIDPTCGSGHFLLGGFARLFKEWGKPENTTGNDRTDAQKALDGVWGIDINPFAVAIARFRLIVAAIQACHIQRLKDAPGWKIHLATGDSLLLGNRWNPDGTKRAENLYFDDSWAPNIYACEEKEAVQDILGQQYHVVVGNPPYIAPGDRALAKAYRQRYKTAFNRYHLSTPFTERFFDLAFIGGASSTKRGYVGLIKDKAFCKREFGLKLIEEFLPTVDLTHILDCEGAYIPGHGTPTVILLGRNRRPTDGVVRAVLGIKGEPGTPSDPSRGMVWQSILKNIESAGLQDDFTSSSDVPRDILSRHPWSIGGGGASELKERLDSSAVRKVSDCCLSVGIIAVTGEDDAYVFSESQARRLGIRHPKALITGDIVRDYSIGKPDVTLWPYNTDFTVKPLSDVPDLLHVLWPYRTSLSQRRRFGTPMLQKGAKWYEWQELYHDKFITHLSIVFAEVATHNNFVIDRGGRIFKNTAPVIKLASDASEHDHLAIMGRLVSSVACFWLKQVSHNKGDSTDQHGARTTGDPAFNTYQFNSTRIAEFPLSEECPIAIVRELVELGQSLERNSVESLIALGTAANREALDEAKQRGQRVRGRMIALQEELDWQCYRLYGLLTEDLCYSSGDLPELALGQRSFEIVMARQISNGELGTTWFKRHGSTPITEIPTCWPTAYRKLVERRIQIIETNKEIALIEKPECKRRWNDEPWHEQEQRALKNWLLDRLESNRYWPDPKRQEPSLQSAAQMADKASGDQDFLQVATLYRGRSDFDVTALVAELVEGEAVPFLPILRCKATGLRKREVWEKTWELQRKEDAGENVGEIKVPPKYVTADFQKTDYWRLRGKLDMPKERWISFPHCETVSDPSLVVGWAGWDHLQQATALVAYYDARKREGWDAKRLTPLLAGLDQLLPWIHQWHPEVDPEFGETAGKSFQTTLEHDAHEVGLTLDDIRSWKPPEKARKAKTTRKKKAAVEDDE